MTISLWSRSFADHNSLSPLLSLLLSLLENHLFMKIWKSWKTFTVDFFKLRSQLWDVIAITTETTLFFLFSLTYWKNKSIETCVGLNSKHCYFFLEITSRSSIQIRYGRCGFVASLLNLDGMNFLICLN